MKRVGSPKTASGLPRSVLRAEIVERTPVEEWEHQGEQLFQTFNRSMWALGDWWNAGEPYGDRVVRAGRIGFEHKTCRNAGVVASAFEVSRRRDTLPWGHHAETASLEAPEQDAWLDKAESDGLSVMALRGELRAALPPRPTPALPAGTYDVLLADPPWQYDFAETDSRQIENQYPTMDVEAIAALQPPAAPDAVLYLWATAPKLREALHVLEAWGFTYVTDLVWVKDKIGMGYWARGRHELLLVGTRGTPGAPEPADRPDSVIEAPRGEHSVKPVEVYDLIETAMPDRTYLELFARTGRDGWTSWGNEL